MEEMATPKQIQFGIKLNIDGIQNMTKAQARDAIQAVVNKEDEVEVVKIPTVKKNGNGTRDSTAMYVSYVKDLIVSGYVPEDAVRVIKSVKAEFE